MRKLLVANRGEIALRVMRTARAMGIATVAVYSDADADAPFVRFADEAVRIGPPPARESYLVIPAILEAARRTGADAIHPGYGFLSENAAFSDAVAEAGLVFVGPPGDVIRKLGSKSAAKRIAQAAGVPVVPGYEPGAANIEYPVLIKASAGGGGKGMRLVRTAAELPEAIERAKGEAKSAFGDDTILLERYIERPRHIEIQILGDTHGNVVHLYERECSIQRRHQKIVEEAPSVALDEARRTAMGEAAVALGKAVGYIGAGTVEFIVPGIPAEPGSLHSGDSDGRFYFLEVNTRLQVEHRVTEIITRLDLVKEQIRIARGEPLGYTAAPPRSGWGIEVRLCAEDADRDYLPTTGTVRAFDFPDCRLQNGVHADMGVVAGSHVGIHYDSMIGKIISAGETREEAVGKLLHALAGLWIPGVVTNREQLMRILAQPAFASGDLHTHFLEQHAGELGAPQHGLERLRIAAVAATLAGIAARRSPSGHELAPPGWRNVRSADQLVTYRHGEHDIVLGYRPEAGGFTFAIGGKTSHVSHFELDGDTLTFVEQGGHRRKVRVIADEARAYVLSEGALIVLDIEPRFPDHAHQAVEGGLVAPMPGKVVKILAAAGDAVAAGAPLVVLEAMKMEHTVRASEAGTVRELHVAVGDQVDAERLLAIVTP